MEDVVLITTVIGDVLQMTVIPLVVKLGNMNKG